MLFSYNVIKVSFSYFNLDVNMLFSYYVIKVSLNCKQHDV